MSDKSLSSIAAGRILAAALASFGCGHAALAADPIFDPMQSWSGPTAVAPSPGGRDIMREAERGPSVTRRLGLPQLSGPLPLELQIERIVPSRNRLAEPPPPPESAQRALRGAR